MDVLMKYLSVLPYAFGFGLTSWCPNANNSYRYKGMTSKQPSSSKGLSPQPTGFSQIQSRGGGEGGGQAMSVLLSWHEKVSPQFLPDRLKAWWSSLPFFGVKC